MIVCVNVRRQYHVINVINETLAYACVCIWVCVCACLCVYHCHTHHNCRHWSHMIPQIRCTTMSICLCLLHIQSATNVRRKDNSRVYI